MADKPTLANFHLWWRKKAEEIIIKTKGTRQGGYKPSSDDLAVDLMQLCRSAELSVKSREMQEVIKNQIKKEQKAHKSLKDVIDFLSSESYQLDAIQILADVEGIKMPEDFLSDLKALEKSFTHLQKVKKSRTQKPETWLISKALPPIYSKHFKRDWKTSFSDYEGEGTGPAIRFTEAFFDLVGIKMTRNGIASAIKRANKSSS